MSAANAAMKLINSKSQNSVLDSVVSPEIMHFIQCSPADFIRKCANGAFLPPRKPRVNRWTPRVSFAQRSKEAPIDNSTKLPSAKRKRDAKDSRSGKRLAFDYA